MRKHIEQIHLSMVNGQRRQAIEQLQDSEMLLSDFFKQYREYLAEMYEDGYAVLSYYSDMVEMFYRAIER